MKVLSGPFRGWEQDRPTAVTLGVFDGVHLGHRDLMSRAFKHEGTPTVITFEPHPIEVLAPGVQPRLITTLDERLQLLEDVGVAVVAVLDLAEVRFFSPDQFVTDVLVDRLRIASLTIGSDFHFGRDRAGDAAFLRRAGDRSGFDVEVVDLVGEGGQTVSSSRIRNLIEAGSVADAARLMGSRYRLSNTVVAGDTRGREIGYPTANLLPVPRKVIPGDGVYATIATVRGRAHMSASNVGTRPTFGEGERLIEAHILDFDEDIYGEDLVVEFVERLRPELEFATVDELVGNIDEDVARSRAILDSVMG